MSRHYRVTWEIDIDTEDDAVTACKKAVEIMRDPDSWAILFAVKDMDSNRKFDVDLGNEEGVKVW